MHTSYTPLTTYIFSFAALGSNLCGRPKCLKNSGLREDNIHKLCQDVYPSRFSYQEKQHLPVLHIQETDRCQ